MNSAFGVSSCLNERHTIRCPHYSGIVCFASALAALYPGTVPSGQLLCRYSSAPALLEAMRLWTTALPIHLHSVTAQYFKYSKIRIWDWSYKMISNVSTVALRVRVVEGFTLL